MKRSFSLWRPTKVHWATHWSVFYNTFKREDEIYKRNRQAFETRFITEANHKRMDAFMVIKRGVEMASYKDKPFKF